MATKLSWTELRRAIATRAGVSEKQASTFLASFQEQLIEALKKDKIVKINGLGTKYSAELTEEETQQIVNGEIGWMLDSGRPLLEELYCKMTWQGLRPSTIVDYTREPFIYSPGNVRVTLDYDIRTGLKSTDLLDPGCVTVPAGNAPIILEVKWDAYLPDIIRDAVQLRGCRSGAFSKYAQCRVYG